MGDMRDRRWSTLRSYGPVLRSGPMAQYVALLRGINVGGKNLIKMEELRACLEAQGLGDVATYIASGNVLFSAPGARAELGRRIEALLSERFRYKSSLVLRTLKEMRDTVENAPDGFGAAPATYRYDVIFLKSPLTAAAALKSVPTRPGVDEARAGAGVLYFSRLTSKAEQSMLPRLVSLPIYQNMTIRNWNTTTKLFEMMRARES